MRRKAAHTLVAVAVIPFTATGSEDTLTEETIVTASFTGANSASAAPIHVLDGEQIAQSGAQSLGEHIDSLLGVSTADSGFAFGDQRFATGWLGYRVAPWLSVTVRLEYEYEDQLSGEYNGAYPRKSPGDDVANYGGEFVTAGIGFNAVAQRGPLAGIRLGLEWESRVDESYNGIQLGAEDGWNLSLSYAF
jgi:hypothetical protein